MTASRRVLLRLAPHADQHLVVLLVRAHESVAALPMQHHAGAPALRRPAHGVRARNEPRQQSLGHQPIVVAEIEALGRQKRLLQRRLLFPEQLRDEVAMLGRVVVEREAELEFAHQLDDEAVHALGVLSCREDALQIGQAKLAAPLRENRAGDDLVDRLGDPMRIEDGLLAKLRIVAIIQRDAQPAQKPGQPLLRLCVCFSSSVQIFLYSSNEMNGFFICASRSLIAEPLRREARFHARHGPQRGDDLLLQTRNPVPQLRLAVGLHKVDDERIFLDQRAPIDVERLHLELVEDHDRGRAGSKRLDEAQPILRVFLFRARATISTDQIETPLGEEEFVRGVLNLLSAEVPHVEADLILAHDHCPRCNGDAVYVIVVVENLSSTSRLTKQVFSTSPRPRRINLASLRGRFAPRVLK